MSILTVKRSDATHSFNSPIENVQTLIKEINEDPSGFNITVTNAEGKSLKFNSPATRSSKSQIRNEILRLQELI
jgi:hypothetical protein